VVGSGQPGDFYRLAGRLARRPDRLGAPSLTFVIFDVLWHADAATIKLPYRERRRLLEALALGGPGWATVPAFEDDVRALMDACDALHLEGMVAKRVDSPYRPGRRSTDWLKLKTAEWKAVHAPLRHEHA